MSTIIQFFGCVVAIVGSVLYLTKPLQETFVSDTSGVQSLGVVSSIITTITNTQFKDWIFFRTAHRGEKIYIGIFNFWISLTK